MADSYQNEIPSEIQKTYSIWLDCADEEIVQELVELSNNSTQLIDSFHRDLAFGTGGLRAVIGAGPNRMNVHTVRKATQGLATYLLKHFDSPSVSIARDSRHMGMVFCQAAAEVLAANNIRVFLYPRIEPTPALSYAVRKLGCSAGICITASHNPAEYNGYKVYGEDGCQITTEAARAIQEAIDKVSIFDDVKRIDFDTALYRNLVAWIDDSVLDDYIDACLTASLGSAKGSLKVVYTPLHGAGLECVSSILGRVGINDFMVEPDQAIANGDFPTCPYPNPEIHEALKKGLYLAKNVSADLLLATDPDADRVGVAVFNQGSSALLSGNEVGILLLDYICTMRKNRGEDLRNLVVCTTIVSSSMADALSANYGFELRRTLTGFKYIGEQIGKLEKLGQIDRFAFGFEESYGYLAGTSVRDKDAVVASMLICEMARWHQQQGINLAVAMDSLYKKYGYYREKLTSITHPGIDGAKKIGNIMDGLRSNPPRTIAGRRVTRIVDYDDSVEMPICGGTGCPEQQMLPRSNVLEFQLESGYKLIIRPSGTEPKIKAYLFSKGNNSNEANAALEQLDIHTRELLS